jgi:hypothetical protein
LHQVPLGFPSSTIPNNLQQSVHEPHDFPGAGWEVPGGFRTKSLIKAAKGREPPPELKKSHTYLTGAMEKFAPTHIGGYG